MLHERVGVLVIGAGGSGVFLKAVAGLHTFRGGNFAAWMYRIARNCVVDRQRRQPIDLPLPVMEPRSGEPSPEEAVIEDFERAVLLRNIAGLPRDQRAAIELKLADWPDQRTAAALGKTVAAVKKLRFRAVRRLRARLNVMSDKGGLK